MRIGSNPLFFTVLLFYSILSRSACLPADRAAQCVIDVLYRSESDTTRGGNVHRCGMPRLTTIYIYTGLYHAILLHCFDVVNSFYSRRRQRVCYITTVTVTRLRKENH